MRDKFCRLARVLFFITVNTVVFINYSHSQITSSGYSWTGPTGYTIEYPDTVLHDNIYSFCNETGNLTAALAGVQGEFDFEWSLYDPGLPGFGPPFFSSRGASSVLSDLGSGGYRVRISGDNGTDTLFRAWIFVNSPSAYMEVVRHDCQVIDLAGTVDTDIFAYFDPITGEALSLPADYDFLWSADPFIPVSSARLDPRIWAPPPVVTDYTLRVNYYSCEAVYTITEDPVTTRAGFEFEPAEGEAPLEVMFDPGNSLNAVEYEWFFDYRPGDMDTGLPDDYSSDPVYIYYIPGQYNVGLRTVSSFLCESEFIHPEPVNVLFSMLEVPNVFTPDGDGFNDIFEVNALSLREFHAVIYNRYGRRIFEWGDPSEGWDGKIEGNNLASPGVYFYIITGIGWDDKEYEFTGPLYLYRGR